jgi:hypothetical protein
VSRTVRFWGLFHLVPQLTRPIRPGANPLLHEEAGGYRINDFEKYGPGPKTAKLGPSVAQSLAQPLPKSGPTPAPSLGTRQALKKERENLDKRERNGSIFPSQSFSSPRPPTLLNTAPLDIAIRDFSQEFGDEVHISENIAQVRGLWERSGLPEQTFVLALYQARADTRKAMGSTLIDNKAAYFFKLLREQVRAKEEPMA